MDWKSFFEKKLIENKTPPTFNIYLAPKDTRAVLELKNQKIKAIQEDFLVTKPSESSGESYIRYEDIYYVYLSRECMIVTAAVGSRFADEVIWLKSIRDTYLDRSFTYYRLISGFDAVYYIFSPRIARTMLVNRSLKKFIRVFFVIPFLQVLRALQESVVHRLLNMERPEQKG